MTAWPARLSWSAQASPAGPEPTTATFRPVRCFGGRGFAQPSAKARSTIETSMPLIVTGGLLMPRTHADSQGAGQTRPVNSGKLFVERSDWRAASHRPRYTRSLKSGMTFPRGQPVWQKGTPQFMQRAPWTSTSSWASGITNSCQWRIRLPAGSYEGVLRSNSLKPVSLPIVRPQATDVSAATSAASSASARL